MLGQFYRDRAVFERWELQEVESEKDRGKAHKNMSWKEGTNEPRLKVKCSTGQRLDDFVWLEHEVVADESGMVQRVRLWEAD